MKPKRYKWILFSCVLLLYSFLYIATTVDRDYEEAICEGVCEKVRTIDSTLRLQYPKAETYVCNTDQVCVNVYDSTMYNWKTMADSTCELLSENGLQKYTVSIIRVYGSTDSVFKQTCP